MRLPHRVVVPLTAALAALVAWTLPAGAAASPYAPTDRPGPPLSVPASALAASLTCDGNLAGGQEPVLLVPGTTLDTRTNFSWNYEKGLSAAGRPWCAVDVPAAGMADIQVAGQYVVSAIRTLRAKSGRKVEVVGYSQGGMSPRFALRFWPDTRPMVDDVVSIDPSNHGTYDANTICTLTCAPSIWQQEAGSHFLDATNSGAETWAGIDYTVIWSDTDEVVFPNVGPAALSALHTGAGRIANVAVQTICPLDTSEHLEMGTIDPVAYALVMDAITHPGTGSAARVPAAVCTQPTSPPVDRTQVLQNEARVVAMAGYELATYPHVPAEPALAPYVYR